MRANFQEPTDLDRFTKEILNGKLHFLRSRQSQNSDIAISNKF